MSEATLDFSISRKHGELYTHPQAIRPNFQWGAQFPTHWAFLTTDPNAQQQCIDQIIDDYLRTADLEQHQIDEFSTDITCIIENARDRHILHSFLFPLPVPKIGSSACLLFLQWQNFHTQQFGWYFIDQAFGNRKDYTHHKSRYNNRYASFSTEPEALDGNPSPSGWQYQTITPVPATTWACFITGIAPSAELAETLRNTVIRMTESLHFYPNKITNQFRSTSS